MGLDVRDSASNRNTDKCCSEGSYLVHDSYKVTALLYDRASAVVANNMRNYIPYSFSFLLKETFRLRKKYERPRLRPPISQISFQKLLLLWPHQQTDRPGCHDIDMLVFDDHENPQEIASDCDQRVLAYTFASFILTKTVQGHDMVENRGILLRIYSIMFQFTKQAAEFQFDRTFYFRP